MCERGVHRALAVAFLSASVKLLHTELFITGNNRNYSPANSPGDPALNSDPDPVKIRSNQFDFEDGHLRFKKIL